MASRFGTRRVHRTSLRRSRQWTPGAYLTGFNTFAANSSTMATLVDEADMDAAGASTLTVARILGTIRLENDDNNNYATQWFYQLGIVKALQSYMETGWEGGGGQPTLPNISILNDQLDWLWMQKGVLSGGDRAFGSALHYIDSKSKRRLKRGEGVYLFIQASVSGAVTNGLKYSYWARPLVLGDATSR